MPPIVRLVAAVIAKDTKVFRSPLIETRSTQGAKVIEPTAMFPGQGRRGWGSGSGSGSGWRDSGTSSSDHYSLLEKAESGSEPSWVQVEHATVRVLVDVKEAPSGQVELHCAKIRGNNRESEGTRTGGARTACLTGELEQQDESDHKERAHVH